MGIQSIAVSLDCTKLLNYVQAAEIGAQVVKLVAKQPLPTGTFLNVNVPDIAKGKLKGIRFTRQCKVPIHGDFHARKDPLGRTYYWMTGRPPAAKDEADSDSYLMKRNYAVIAPIHCDTTDHKWLAQSVSNKLKI